MTIRKTLNWNGRTGNRKWGALLGMTCVIVQRHLMEWVMEHLSEFVGKYLRKRFGKYIDEYLQK